MSLHTADLADAHPEAMILQPGLSHYGGRRSFDGVVSTVRCDNDNSLVKGALAEAGSGRVLVVDGGASLQCALLGDRLAAAAIDNGWSGVIVNGCVRDADQLAGMALGVVALGTHPRRSVTRGRGERDITVTFRGVDFVPGHWACVDADGTLVLPVAPAG